eukprot:TRINITY_DN9506_c0_g2_i6.p1 TRINITY_DN9506_c0_g2~~TRINITY_DN9506_c0_g2_i6.p1  ORF type:complete len:408 (-),score=35.91 TRINITY_DN9506_c0_g2_i6:29-1252(-)
MERAFTLEPRHHGKGSIIFAWHPSSRYVATIGSSRVVHIFDRRGKLLHQLIPPSSTSCIGLEWDNQGETLAVLQESWPELVLFEFQSRKVELVQLPFREPTFVKWAKNTNKLAVGSSGGEILIFTKSTGEKVLAVSRHKKRITCADWSHDNKLAFASDDRQITIATEDGLTYGQVKVKSKPTKVKFGGNQRDRENIVSVSMDRKTILLYNLDDPENALELAFQQRYGHIVAFKWFREGYVMVAFSFGYLVVISTHLTEIGREQFCAKFHKDNLRDIAYCPTRHKVATCGDNCIKIVDMQEWKELQSEILEKDVGNVDRVSWSADGSILSVSTKNGYLLNYVLEPSVIDTFNQGSKPAVWVALRPLNTMSLCICFLIVGIIFFLALASVFDSSWPQLLVALFAAGPVL